MLIDADADAFSSAVSFESSFARDATKAPAKTSPAPVGSTTLVTGKASTAMCSVNEKSSAPLLPFFYYNYFWAHF